MPDDTPLKSAFELAMERLRAKDREEGVEEHAPLTEVQKDAIAAARQETQAKLAEMEILHRQNLQKAGGVPEEIVKVEESYRTDRARLEDRLASKITRIRRGGAA